MKILNRLIFVVLLSTAAQARAATLYAAPAALGNGSGSSASNAAYYGNATFWNGVQSTLGSQTVTVFLVDGNYTSASLDLKLKGNATNQLVVQGVSANGTILNASVDLAISLIGARNIMIKNVHFIGNGCKLAAVALKRDTATMTHCRDIVIDGCRFEDLNNVGTNPNITGGAAIDINFAETYNITVRNCTFKRVGYDRFAHIFYVKFGAHHITIHNNLFEDSTGVALKFRDEISNVAIYDNTFVSTGTWAKEDEGSRGLIFIDVRNQNDEVSDSEIFGNYYDIYDNSFSYATTGTYPRKAIELSHSGYETGGYNQIPSASEAQTLGTGGPHYKRAFLTSAGINTESWNIHGNTYSGVDRRINYAWYGGGGSGTGIYNALGYKAEWTYGFEGDTGSPDGWSINEAPPDTQAYCTTTWAGHGDTCVRLKDTSTSQYTQMYKPLTSNIGRGYYRALVQVQSNGTTPGDHFIVFTNGATPIYWVKAKVGGTWGNNSTTFSGSWTTGVWYMVEMEFSFSAGKYNVWIDNAKVADWVDIPTSNTSMSGNLVIKPAYVANTGTLLVDFLRLGIYE